MKKYLFMLIAMLIWTGGLTILSSATPNQSPVINGVSDLVVSKTTGTYDPLTTISVSDDEDGTIDNSKVTVIIVDLSNNVIINQIDLSKDGRYRIEYEVKDSTLNLTTASMLLTVGNGIPDQSSNLNPIFTGMGTFKADKRIGAFDPLKGVHAYNYLGADITNSIEYEIKALSINQTVDVIDFNHMEKYIITYRVSDQENHTSMVDRTVIIGDINPYVSSFAGYKGIGYVYDYDQIDDYQLVWSDEFDYTGTPDPSKWNYTLEQE